MSKKRRKLKSSITLPQVTAMQVHDRRATELPYNHKIAVVTVDDPYGIREFAADAPVSPGARANELRAAAAPKVSVIVSLRDDPLRSLYVRESLSELQYMAGIRYRDDIDTSIIGGARAIDYSRPAVDGGRLGDPLRDSVSAALDRLARADAVLRRGVGHGGVALCRAVLGEGMTVSAHMRRIGMASKHSVECAVELFRASLDQLAEVYGLATKRVA